MGGINSGKIGYAFLVIMFMLFIFLLVYKPHMGYPFPYHIDEWHHITEAMKMRYGGYSWGSSFSLEPGFHLSLAFLSFFTDLVLSYKYLPALFASLSGLAVYFFLFEATRKRLLALLGMLVFASIRSDVNITGLWFFTPLAMAIPFIYVFYALISRWFRKKDNKILIQAFLILAVIFFIHPVSATFTLPVFFLFFLFQPKIVRENLKPFLLVIFSLLFFLSAVILFLWQGSFTGTITFILNHAVFRHGWGVLELNIPLSRVYPPILSFFAVIGAWLWWKKRLLFVMWPFAMLLQKLFFEVFGFSVLVPYQRASYYLALGLVPLSAVGIYAALSTCQGLFSQTFIKKAFVLSALSLILAVSFNGYYAKDFTVELYRLIDKQDYDALKALEPFPGSIVLAPTDVSAAVYPVSRHGIIASYFFYGSRSVVDDLYRKRSCPDFNSFIRENSVGFVFSRSPLDCGWKAVYSSGPYIYDVGS